MNLNETLLTAMLDLQGKIEILSSEIKKTSEGNKAAGGRARKEIKHIQLALKEIRKLSLELSKGV